MEELVPIFIKTQKDKDDIIYYIKRIKVPEHFKLNSFNAGEWMSINTIKFEFCNFTEFPRAKYLLDFLPHLNKLSIPNCGLSKITSEDLRGLKDLKSLDLTGNDIEKLPKGLFDLTPHLEWISFADNLIMEIDADILKPLRSLKFFNLLHNTEINIKYEADQENVTLEMLQEAIEECDPMRKLRNEMREEMSEKVDMTETKVFAMEKRIMELEKEKNSLTSKFEKSEEEKFAMKKKIEELENVISSLNSKFESSKEETLALKREIPKLQKLITSASVNRGLELVRMINRLSVDVNQLKRTVERNFTVVINGKSFKVNKEILIANSPMLAKMINDNPSAHKLELFEISEETFKHILKYMMTKNPPSENVNYIELFAAAARLEMESLVDVSAGVLMEKITPENAPDIMKICQKFGYKELCEKAYEVVKKSF